MRLTEDGNSKDCGGVLPLLLGAKLIKDMEHPYLILDERLVNILGCSQSAKSLAGCIVMI